MIKIKKTSSWTDHNPHDPGITLLEHLAYAISDVSYRLGFSVEDLLAEAEAGAQRPFFSAREILPQAPLTLPDYRKLLLDCSAAENGRDRRLVKNAWLRPLRAPEATAIRHRFWSNPNRIEWRYDGPDEKIYFKGDYEVLVEPFQLLSPAEKDAIIALLRRHRNLGEDFPIDRIRFLEDPESITVEMEIDLEGPADPQVLYENIRRRLDEAISPNIRFYRLAEMTARSQPAEEIFRGPRLAHGFIDEEELRRFDKKTSLRGSDFLRLVMDEPGVQRVRGIVMSSSLSPDQKEKQYLKLAADRAPRLAQFIPHFFRGRHPLAFSPPAQPPATMELSPVAAAEDLPIPTGKYRDPGRFFSIAHDLPHLYGVGPGGLPAAAAVQREAQALQLKAYIALFEQILANYLGQTAHCKDLFNIHYGGDQTYFPQFPDGADGIPGFETLRRQVIDLYRLTEPAGKAEERLNRLLDHLLARFAERMPELPQLVGAEEPAPGSGPAPGGTHILRPLPSPGVPPVLVPPPVSTGPSAGGRTADKRRLLRRYAGLSYGRGLGMDYSQAPPPWRGTGPSGLEKRLEHLLAIQEPAEPAHPQLSVEFPASEDTDGTTTYRFRVLERSGGKILLSSNSAYPDLEQARQALTWTLRQAAWPDRYQPAETKDGRFYFSVTAPTGEILARRIEYFRAPAQQEEAMRQLRELLSPVPPSGIPFYLVEHCLIRPPAPADTSRELVFPEVWASLSSPPQKDPWSLQLSLVFQDRSTAGTRAEWEGIIEEQVGNETPVHLSPRILWFDPNRMHNFESVYLNWRRKWAVGEDVRAEVNALNEQLGICRYRKEYHGLGLLRAGSAMIAPNTCLFSGNQITVSFWTKLELAAPGEWNAFLKATPIIARAGAPLLISFQADKVAFTCGRSGLNTDTLETTVPADTLSRWNHWAFVKDVDRGVMIIYLNGISIGSASRKTLALPGPQQVTDLWFGNKTREESMRIQLADVRIWRIARSREDILLEKDYRLGRMTTIGPLHVYWKLNENEGATAANAVALAPHENDAHIQGGTWI